MDTQQDFEKRRAEFLEAFGKIREEFQVDFVHMIVPIPNELKTVDGNSLTVWQNTIQSQLVDLKEMLVKSPIIA